MNRSHARRTLTGIDRIWVTQTWTSSMYWVVRTRLWRAADLTVPDRIRLGDGLTKTQLDQMAHDKAGHPVPARRLSGQFRNGGNECAAVAPGWLTPSGTVSPYRAWQAIAVDESYLVGLSEIAGSADMKVDLNRLSVSWWDDGQLVAVLLGITRPPVPVETP